MARGSGWQYYAAVLASGISTAGWLGAVAFGVYTAYLSLTGGDAEGAATVMLAAVAVGAVFAMIEKRLYRVGGAD